ncbi:MAG: tetratricopeptide repeat protein [bacterium]
MTRAPKTRRGAARASPPSWALLAAILGVFAFALHANVLGAGFVLDDEYQVQRNPWIRDWRHLPEMFSSHVWNFLPSAPPSNYYRPLMHVIYAATFQLFGLRAWGFHLVNLLLHAVNTVLVFLFARRIAAVSGEPHASDDERLGGAFASMPFVAGLLFASHPVHTEAVDWIASVPELAFTAFGLMALLVHAASPRRPVLAALFLFCALLSKETAITLLGVCFAYDLAFPRRPRSYRDWLAAYLPLLVATAIYLAIRQRVLSHGLLPRSQALAAFGPSILDPLRLFCTYLRTLVLPDRLHFWHSFRPLDSPFSLAGITSIAVAAAFLAALALAWKRHRASFFALAALAMPLAPTFLIGALPGKPFAERYLYFPSVGFVVLAASWLSRLLTLRRARAAAIAVAVATLGLYAVTTVRQNRVWHDFYSLYLRSMDESPDAPVPCDDLAHALFAEGRAKEAIVQLGAQVKLDPKRADCQSALGSALLLDGRVEEAIAHLESALAIDPGSLASYNDLGVALRRKGDDAAAIEQYRKALRLAPGYAEAHFSLGSALADLGQTAEALAEYRAAVRAQPDNAYYRAVLGIECGKQGLLDEAIEQFREAIRLDPREPAYRRNLERAQGLKARGD